MSSNPNPSPGHPTRPGQPLQPGQIPSQFNTAGAHQPQRPTTAEGTLQLTPGSRPLPEYELVQLIGQGGFGQVWRAKGPGGFTIALKFISLNEKSGSIEMRSLELMREIRHPHLLTMFGAWQMHGYLIIAMELADHTTYDYLTACLKKGWSGTPPEKLMDFMRDAAVGIDHLNSLGIQHRDIKPQNLLLVGGSVKVADFGLAKVTAATDASHTGQQTLAYAAPEFFQGKVSPQSDQYSLAATYCHLRANQLPFGGNMAEMLSGHLMRQPTLAFLPTVAERNIVAKALAKNPAERWPNCRAFVEALRAAVLQPGVPLPTQAIHTQKPSPPSPPTGAVVSKTQILEIDDEAPSLQVAPPNKMRRYAVVGGVAAAMVVLGIGVGLAIKPKPTPSVTEQQNTDAARTAREQGLTHLSKKEFTEAIASFDEAVKHDNRDAESLIGRGRAKLALDQPDGTIEDCTRALSVSPQSAPAAQLRGDAHLAMLEYEKALEDARTALKNQPDMIEAYLTLARVHTAQADYAAALEDCKKAMEKSSRDARVWVTRGEVYLAHERFSLAIDDFDRAIEMDSKTPQYLVLRAQAKVLRDGAGAGKDDLTKAVSLFKPTTPQEFVGLGRVHLELLEYKPALEAADRAAQGDTLLWEVVSLRADVFEAQGDRDKAIAERRKGIAALDKARLATQWLTRAKLSYGCGEYEKAITDCSEAIKRAPRFVDSLVFRSQLYSQARGDFVKALADIDETLRIAPGTTGLHYLRALALIDADDPEQATLVLDQLQRLSDTECAQYHARVAWVQRRLNKKDAALKAARECLDRAPRYLLGLQARGEVSVEPADLDRAIDLAPNDPELRLSRARILRAKKQPEQARRDLDEYLRRSPHTYRGHLNYGQFHDFHGKWAEAVTSYSDALKAYSQGGWARWERAQTYEQMKELTKAREDYDELIKAQPNKAPAYAQRGWLKYSEEQYSDARDDYEKALTVHKSGKRKRAMYLNGKARCLHELALYNEALTIYGLAAADAPEWSAPLNNRALTYTKLKKYTDAIHDLEKAKEFDGDSALYNANLGFVHFEKGDHRQATDYYARAIDKETKPLTRGRYLFKRGECWFKLKEFASARDDYREAVRLNNAPEHISALGTAYFELTEWDLAIEQHTRAIEATMSKTAKAQYLARRAQAYLARGNFADTTNKSEEARKDWNRAADDCLDAIKLNDNDAAFHGRLGVAYRKLKLDAACERAFTAAIGREKDSLRLAEFYYERGAALTRQKKYPDALQDYKAAVEKDPNDGIYQYWVGEGHSALNQWKEAVDAYNEALKRLSAPKEKAVCYQFRGWAKHMLGQTEEGVKDVTTAIELDETRWGAYSDRAALYDKLNRPDDAKRDREKSEELKKKSMK